jgi:adenylate cyclase
VIAYDVQFSEPTVSSEDNRLIDAVSKAPHVVLGTTDVLPGGKSPVFGGPETLNKVGAVSGNVQFPTETDGIIRRIPYSVEGLESLALLAAEQATGHRIARSALGGSTALIDYRGKPGTFNTVRFSDLVEGRVPPSLLRGKIVVVGATAPSLHDQHFTPFASDQGMSGPEVEANAIDTALRAFPLGTAGPAADIILILLLATAIPLAAIRLRAPWLALAAPLLAGLYLVFAQLLFSAGTIVTLVYPIAGLIIGTLLALGVQLILSAVERERVRDLFARFVPETVVDQVLAKADEDLRLGGERRTVTILFSDIRGFTTFSETRTPDEVIKILNRYLTIMTDAVLANGGTLVSYIGDGIMALFGAPIEQADHADRALATARQMVGPCLDEFNDWMEQRGVGERFRIGIGLNSGPVMVGNVGSERRLEYTAIGDVTNTASRLEGMTKGTPHMIFMSGTTQAALHHSDGLVHVDDMPVRGRLEPVGVWTVREPSREPVGA